MKHIIGKVVEVNLGKAEDELVKSACDSIQAELDGFVGDRHRSLSREAWAGDKQPEGTIRRNERQWSAMSVEETADIQQKMDLKEPLPASKLGVNLCFEGIPQLSLLPKGTILKFSSGAELMVEEYNPPCIEMSEKVADNFSTNSGKPISKNAFSQAAIFTRGLVGVIEVAGQIKVGDEVKVEIYQPPVWMANLIK
ncbi:MAG: hypothetical protein HRT37_01460 [Alteromonadaceae bacterium]|nr:hypothetical protein [Alteromonadaceae bacterium]